MFSRTLFVAGVFTMLGSFAEAAMVDRAVYRENRAAGPGINLGDVANSGGPTIGPAGLSTPFDHVGDEVVLFGGLGTGLDDYQVNVLTPSLRVDVTGLDFIGGGTLSITVSSDEAVEDGAIFDFTPGDGVGTLGQFAGITGLTFDNTTSGEVIAYDVRLVATPLPGGLVLLATGLVAVAGYGRLRRSAMSAGG